MRYSIHWERASLLDAEGDESLAWEEMRESGSSLTLTLSEETMDYAYRLVLVAGNGEDVRSEKYIFLEKDDTDALLEALPEWMDEDSARAETETDRKAFGVGADEDFANSEAPGEEDEQPDMEVFKFEPDEAEEEADRDAEESAEPEEEDDQRYGPAGTESEEADQNPDGA